MDEEENWLGLGCLGLNEEDAKKLEQMFIERALLHPTIAKAYVDNLQQAIEFDMSETSSSSFLPGVTAFAAEKPKIGSKIASKVQDIFVSVSTEAAKEAGKELEKDFFANFEDYEKSVLELAQDMRLEQYKTLLRQTTVMSHKFSQLLPSLVTEYTKADVFSDDSKCHPNIFTEVVIRERNHVQQFVTATTRPRITALCLPNLTAISIPVRANRKDLDRILNNIIARHAQIIEDIEMALSFQKSFKQGGENYDENIDPNVGSKMFIIFMNRHRQVLFNDYEKSISTYCDEIEARTNEYLKGRWSVKKALKRIVHIGNWHALQDKAIKEAEIFKQQINDMYSVLEQLVEMTVDKGTEEGLRLSITNAQKRLVKLRNLINTVYRTYVQHRNSLKRYR